MRTLTDIELARIKVLTDNSVALALIEPTQTGLNKSIMDATGPLRFYLKDKGLHDYEKQKQGLENKVQIDSLFVRPTTVLYSIASLYRPNTKKGDPRIWFKDLKDYVRPNDILGLFEFSRKIYVLNLTRIDVHTLLRDNNSNPLRELVAEIKRISNAVADELLILLKTIAKKGPVPALLNADTAVGRTLEMLLGISINSSKMPDYKGIELKSFRSERKNRKNLFAQVPDWSISKFKSSAEILQNFGYQRSSDLKLYCTVSTRLPNSQGLMLELNTTSNLVIEKTTNRGIGNFVAWPLQTLHNRLLEKHNETFWIAAESTYINGQEHFLYTKVEHTKKPIVSQFDILLEQGIITLDHLIKKNIHGKVVEKGPLFKIRPNAISLLFPPSRIYELR